MAKNLRKVYYDEFGNLINEDCAGTVTTYENPCGCGDSDGGDNGTTPPPVIWDETKCRVATFVANTVFDTKLRPALDTIRNLGNTTEPFFSAALTGIITSDGLPLSLFADVRIWAEQVLALDTTGINQEHYDPQAICTLMAVLPESAQIDSVVVDAWQAKMRQLGQKDDYGMWEAAYGFLEWYPVSRLQEWAFSASLATGGIVDCSACSGEIPVEPCPANATFETVVYNWDDDELSGSPACYSNGQFQSCEPYNSREISGGNFTLTLAEPVCISIVRFSIAGNGLVAWHEVKIVGVRDDNTNVELGTCAVEQRTKCVTPGGTPTELSAGLALPKPVSIKQLIFTPTRWAGNPAAAQHLHCVHLAQAAPVPAFRIDDGISVIQSTIAAAPAGSYFYWEAGDYPINDIQAKAGDKHIALAPGVRWYGAKALPANVWTWHASGVWKTPYTRVLSEKASTMGGYAISGRSGWNINMYADSVVIEHVTALSGSGFTAPNQFCYDDQASTLYINFDPDQFDLIEVTDIRKAATLNNANFHLENIEVYGYASHLAEGAIHAANVKNASDMKIINCDFVRNSGDGIKVGRRALVRNVQCIENGHDGLTGQGYALADSDAGADGSGDIVLDNLTCRRNNTKNVNVQYQGGNVKITRCNGLTVNNYVGEDAYGTDFWLDLSVKNAAFNRFLSRNAKARAGLFLEKSYSITGDDITIIRAQKTKTSHPWEGQLLVRTSQDVSLTNVKIVGADTGSGTSGGWIGIVEDNNAGDSDVYGTPHQTRNVVIEDVDVYTTGANPQRGGLATNWTNPSQQWTDFWAGGNLFINLRLHVPAGQNAVSWYQHTGSNVAYSTIAAATAYYTDPTIDNAAIPADLE